MDKIEIEEELICSLAVKGEKSIHKLLLNILAIVKQLKTIQSDPVLTYQVSTKAQQQLQSQQLQQPQSIPSSTNNSTNTNTNNSTTTTTTSSTSSTTTPTTTTSTTSPLNSKDSTATTTTKEQPSSPTLPTLNLNFVNDNDKIKELNQNCIQSILALQKTIKEISLLETKISQKPKDNIDNDDTIMKDDNNNSSTSAPTTTTINIEKQDQTSLSNELERLKMDAYQKNCVIKKLIDNMRLLQLSINSMNRTSTGTD
ncbi:hypothetical protein DDB_G0274443 [Dictyostelium discoideum AX4]|uniref:Putative mediator of RNA polymerase II transcription subunit 30 n=1 Tax=Dictyostelium discoideum TaxID=44689 RepID=MED30_DICDI|nr:hypothetical protein DDB_G0274443 [Dictyostelium discoideum AX4]Q86HS8.1 RecName: Full=Putative mediator of RNA polymerase II transcription subunit 30; AltName: Full=Mediator complex subunit 30 [Dictyostelium discoideum]EAL70114.1 hypothetical protein DDB_G0274443 [Dictyostelium discoideum AX4]|eukprot:XP_644186.1 hypothetical protein DDB_G0274443 [Dictyostelium discoideum AX4]